MFFLLIFVFGDSVVFVGVFFFVVCCDVCFFVVYEDGGWTVDLFCDCFV